MKPLIGLLRFRNEELILADTLDHMSEFCDKIYIYDDASTDGSRGIYTENPAVTGILRAETWNPDQTNVQGKQRSELFEYAKFKNPDSNFIYLDADERIDFDFEGWDRNSAVVMKLFDARMTEEDQEPYLSSNGYVEVDETDPHKSCTLADKSYRNIPFKLKNFRKYFDPQFREIPFIFNDKARYIGVACERYPQLDPAQPVIHAGFVQHYGKALSKEHWQATCAYYAKYLPIYAEKWEARKKESGVVNKEGLLTWDECKLQ